MRHAAGEMLGEGEQVVVPKAASLKEPTRKLFLLSAQHPQSAVVFYLLTTIPHVQIFFTWQGEHSHKPFATANTCHKSPYRHQNIL